MLNSWWCKALWAWENCSVICNLCRHRSLLLRPQYYARDVACPHKVFQGCARCATVRAPCHYLDCHSVRPSRKMSRCTRVPFSFLHIFNPVHWMLNKATERRGRPVMASAAWFSFGLVLTIFSYHRCLACKLQKQPIVCSFLCAFFKVEGGKTIDATFVQLLSSRAECL